MNWTTTLTDEIMVHRCMIVPEAIATTARALAASFGESSAGMWLVPLCAAGGPVTHRISTGLISESFAGALPLMRQTEAGEWVNTMPEPGVFAALCQAAGVEPPPAEALAAIFAAVDVSDQDPHEAMTRLGLAVKPAGVRV